MQDSLSSDSFEDAANRSAYARLLWDMFLALSIFTITSCVTLHRAGLNDWNNPISIEYAAGNPLAIAFFVTSIGLTVVTGLLYRYYGRMVEALLLLGVLLFLVAMIASKAHTTVHAYSFYATVGGAMVTPFIAFYRLRIWSHFIAVATLALIAVLLLYWISTADPASSTIGIFQRAGFIVAWLSNVSVMVQCEQTAVRLLAERSPSMRIDVSC